MEKPFEFVLNLIRAKAAETANTVAESKSKSFWTTEELPAVFTYPPPMKCLGRPFSHGLLIGSPV